MGRMLDVHVDMPSMSMSMLILMMLTTQANVSSSNNQFQGSYS